MIVDVSRLNGVSLDSSRRAVVGAGARLIDVYDGLWQHRRTVPAGSCPTVGIAGLTLGGGVGLASRKYGLTCDNLLEATVVLANGTAVVANARQHPDLYWALRGGGGGNFGIVTRFLFRTHPVGQVATYSLEWPWSDAAKVVQAWQKLAPHAVLQGAHVDANSAWPVVEALARYALRPGPPGSARRIGARLIVRLLRGEDCQTTAMSHRAIHNLLGVEAVADEEKFTFGESRGAPGAAG